MAALNSKSLVWSYFERMGEKAKCLQCKPAKILTCCGGSTSALRKHLISVHRIKLTDAQEDKQDMQAKRVRIYDNQHSIIEYRKQQSLGELAQLAAEDGFSFLRIVQSKFIRSSLSAKGFIPPKSHSTVFIKAREYSIHIKSCVKKELAELLKIKARFSVSLDEYTSDCNRRYMNVNRHYKFQVWNLGMGRIFNSMPAEIAKDILEVRLREFDILLTDDVVALVTDGASVIKKMGTLSKQLHQLCYAHAIHLAVCEILYDTDEQNDIELPGSSSEILLNLSEINNFELDEEFCDDMLNDIEICDPNDTDIIIPILKHHLNCVISIVRRITKMFRKSPKKNDILQSYERQIRNGKELKLILDCKTRWNSLLSMIERFLDLKKPLSKALIDISCNVNIDEYEWEILEDIQKV